MTAVTHSFVSAKADGADATLVRPSNWNANHTVTYGVHAVTTTDTIALTDDLVTLAAGTYTVTVPLATGSGKPIFINMNGAGVVTLARSGADTLGGRTSFQLLGLGDWCVLTDEAVGVWGLDQANTLNLNSINSRDANLANPRIFRPGDFMAGNTYDPTGAADSTTSFQAMMTAVNAANTRCVIELPAGVFKCNTGVFTGFNAANPLTIHGQGRGVTVLIPTSGTGDMVHLTAGMDGVQIYDFAIYQTGSPQTAGAGINTNGANSVLIQRMFFVNLFQDIFINNSSIKVSIQSTLHSQTNGSATSVGVLVNNGAAGDTYIGPDVVMSNTGATRRRASVEIVQSGHYEVNQCNLTGAAQGILIDPGAGQIVAFGFHNEVLCDSCTVNGMTMNATTNTSTIKNIKSTTSWYSGTIAGSGGAGVLTTGVAGGILDGVTFTNDRFLNNQTHGFQHTFGTDIRFDLCDMKGNSQAAANTSDGLNIAAGVSNWVVVGGKYGGTDAASTGGNQRFGIFIAAGASSASAIDTADLSGNTSGPLSNASTVPILIANCVGYANGFKTTAAAATVLTTVEQVVVQLPIPANSVKVGTVFRVSLSYHPAATTIITVRMRIGAAGTTADAALVTLCATAATNAGTRYAEGTSGVQVIGANATHLGSGCESVGAISACGVQTATSGTFNSTVANFVSVTLQNTSSTTTTVYAAELEILSN